MSISSAINAARSGLQISGLRADIVATNVANATTPGYVRRSLNISENLLAGRTAGVRATGVSRSQDAALTAERRLTSSDLSQASVMASTWESISARLGDTAEGAGLFKSFSDFEAALSDAALSPESSANASAVLDAANSIIREFRGLSTMAQRLRAEADQSIREGVDVINASLKQIEDLNTKITRAQTGSAQEAGLMDERQRVLDTIAEYLPVQTVERETGAIDVLTREGVFLLAGSAKELEFTPSAAFSADRSLANGDLSGISVGGTDITPGANSFGAVSSGMFGALFAIRDRDVPEFNAQLDTLAGDIMNRLSADGIDPTTPAGAAGLFIDTDPAAAGLGLAERIALNPAIDPAQGGSLFRLRDGLGATAPGPTGNATILNNMLAAVTALQPINQTGIQGTFSSSDMVAQLASLTGQTRIHHDSVLASVTTQHAMLDEAEKGLSGVDIDTQMQDLLLIEQAYAANARVIEVAGAMLNRLMEI
ncbi:MAG: flagellar hook-associated protein FlgK [Hyphomonadaceae bacterium]|nr:flagellar hook-associated protein FlgK [Hyphomonadaceae bacterium]